MKTKELLDKYQKVISGMFKCKPEDIKFFVNDNEINEIEYFAPEKDENDNETGNQIRYTRWPDWSEGNYIVKIGDQNIASFQLYKLPHCCAILVSCKAFIYQEYRNQRLGTLMNTFRTDIARILGYSTLMCTDVEQNIYQRKLLKTNGWKDIFNVINKRTNNRVYVSVINV